MIKDTGKGITAEKLEVIFGSFNMRRKDTTPEYGGTGSGLTITKWMLELQGGTFVVGGKPMTGSAFSFMLSSEKKITPSIESASTAEKLQQEQANLSLNILLAEDNEINQFLIEKVLSDWGMKTQVVENGKQALDALEKESFDLILMDMQMPVMDGYEAIGRIRNLDNAKAKLPIISLTAHTTASEIEKCIAAGANAYVSKPFEREELYETIIRLTSISKDQESVSED